MSFNNPAVWLLAAMVVPCAFLAVRYWQRALFGVFVLLVFEGALRKWALPSAQAQIYLVKDVILLAVYLGFILDGQRHQPALRDASSDQDCSHFRLCVRLYRGSESEQPLHSGRS